MKKFDGLLLGCDMDGTLLDSRKQISAKNQEAIWYFVKNGGSFSLATGRAPRAIDIYRTLLPFNAPYTHLNGSLIMDSSQNIMWCAGMPHKTVELMDNIRKIRDEFRIAVLLIEHDMNLVMNICEGICVLNYGKVIAKGTAEEIKQNPVVIEAYLGNKGE